MKSAGKVGGLKQQETGYIEGLWQDQIRAALTATVTKVRDDFKIAMVNEVNDFNAQPYIDHVYKKLVSHDLNVDQRDNGTKAEVKFYLTVV